MIHLVPGIDAGNTHERARKRSSFRNIRLEHTRTIGPIALAPGLLPADARPDR